MIVTISRTSYNARRYLKPFIGKVTAWPVGKKYELSFGAYAGNSGGGELEIECEQGDVIRWGQKDLRSNRQDYKWGVVLTTGEYIECSESEARRQFRCAQENVV
jgi:hypothetical protein